MALSTRTDLRPTCVALIPASDEGSPAALRLAAGLLAPRLVRRTPTTAHVVLVATTATLLGGDVLDLEVAVGPGLRLDLGDVAGTVAYHGRGRSAQVRAHLQVAAGATLVWAGEPLVVSEGAQVERLLIADVDKGGRLLVRDQVALGREGEEGGSLWCRTELAYAGQPTLVETLDLRGRREREEPSVLGVNRVIDTVTAVGWRPPAPDGTGPQRGPGPVVYALSQPGAQARNLVRASHESTLPALWKDWSEAVGVRYAG
jgi:urease accessory protein